MPGTQKPRKMNQIEEKTEKSAVQVLTDFIPSNNPMIVALQAKRIRDLDDFQIVSQLSEAILKARFDLGLRTDGTTSEDKHFFLDSVLVALKESFSMLTMPEVKLAVNNFTMGNYTPDGKVFLSVSALCQAFARYMSDQNRQEAKKQLERLREPEPDQPTEQEKQALRIENVKKAWQDFKKNGNYEDVGNAVFTTLNRLKLFPYQEARRQMFKEQAKRNLQRFYNPVTVIGNTGKQSDFKKILSGLENGSEQDRIIIEAKKIALNTFFADMVELGEEIETLLESC